MGDENVAERAKAHASAGELRGDPDPAVKNIGAFINQNNLRTGHACLSRKPSEGNLVTET